MLRGPDEAVEGLLLTVLLTFSNRALFSAGDIASIARWIIIILSFFRVSYSWLIQETDKNSPWIKFLFIFGIYVILNSIFFSRWPIASFIKINTFLVVILTVYLGIKLGQKDWIKNIIWFGFFITLLSIPLLIMPEGYLRNGTQFQGILSHPQSYGVIIVIPFSLAFGYWIIDNNFKTKWYQFAALGMMAITILLSGSRTGYFAFFLALLIGIFVYKDTKMHLMSLLFHPLTYFAIAFTIAIFWITTPKIQFEKFIFERDITDYAYYDLPVNPESSAIEHLIASRSSLIK